MAVHKQNCVWLALLCHSIQNNNITNDVYFNFCIMLFYIYICSSCVWQLAVTEMKWMNEWMIFIFTEHEWLAKRHQRYTVVATLNTTAILTRATRLPAAAFQNEMIGICRHPRNAQLLIIYQIIFRCIHDMNDKIASRLPYVTLSRHISSKICPFSWGDLDPIEYVVPWAHPIYHSIRNLDRVSRFSIIHGRHQRTEGWTDGRTDRRTDGRTEGTPNSVCAKRRFAS